MDDNCTSLYSSGKKQIYQILVGRKEWSIIFIFSLSKDQVQASVGELGALVRAFLECIQFVLNLTLKTSKDKKFIEIIISDQVRVYT